MTHNIFLCSTKPETILQTETNFSNNQYLTIFANADDKPGVELSLCDKLIT